jgi:hypothetical protein
VYFEDQDVLAVVKMYEIKKRVEGMLMKPVLGFVPEFICQP